MHSITDVIQQFKQNWTEELSVTAMTQACHEAGMTWRETMLSPAITIHEKGFRPKEITLVTTLLDAKRYTLSDLAEQFRQRWAIETNFGHLKTTMKMDVLKCKTVDGVLRELQVFALIYNMVRQVMLEAAGRQKVDVGRISFMDALRWLQTASSGDEIPKLVVNPYRPNRLEPRVKKRRPKPYPLMTKPRCQLKKELDSK